MIKIDIISGFLGAGKTTLINKLISAYEGEKIVLVENEFGEVGIDGGFLKETGINIAEINSGCICCSLTGDFSAALKEVAAKFAPNRIIIEPSGVGKLGEVIKAVESAALANSELNSRVTVVDATRCGMYLKNFGEFFAEQIENAHCVVFSRSDKLSEEKLEKAVSQIKELNKNAVFIITPIEKLDAKTLRDAVEGADEFETFIEKSANEMKRSHNNCCCECGHDHGHKHEHHACEHEHKDHHADGHHNHGQDECGCGHDHAHSHGENHSAAEVFTSFGQETVKRYSEEDIVYILNSFANSARYGNVLRAKGIVEGNDGNWIYFDYLPGESDIRNGLPGTIGKFCVIGSGLCDEEIAALFGVSGGNK